MQGRHIGQHRGAIARGHGQRDQFARFDVRQDRRRPEHARWHLPRNHIIDRLTTAFVGHMQKIHLHLLGKQLAHQMLQ